MSLPSWPPNRTDLYSISFPLSLRAYYVEIYPHAPLLPAGGTVPLSTILATLGPSRAHILSNSSPGSSASGSSRINLSAAISANCSPLLLSILAILALAPHPQDPAPSSSNSRALRRRASARYAAESFKLVDDAVDAAGEEGTDLRCAHVHGRFALCTG